MARIRIPRVGRSWTARTAIVLGAVSLGALALVQTTGRAGGTELASAASRLTEVATVTDPQAWVAEFGSPIAPVGKAGTLEVRVDDLIDFLGSTGASSVDRSVLRLLARGVMPGTRRIERVTLGDILARYPRVRIVVEGRSVVFGRLAMRALARRLVGATGRPIDDTTVGELLDAMPAVRIAPDGTPSTDESTVGPLRALLASIRKQDPSRDARFAERVELQARYRLVLDVIQELRLEGAIRGGSDPYDAAYARLIDAGREDAIPLLDGALKLKTELDGIDGSTLSRPERIASRWEARRVAFGDDVASLLFGRQEALERYQIDTLRISSNKRLSQAAKARRLARRRTQLKVELAAQGSYVGFVDEARVGGGK